MNRNRKLLCAVYIIALIFPLFLHANKKSKLPAKYRKWIKEEVVYIITQKEKEVFYKLEIDRERDFFIEEFWRQRDPTPGSPRNEFREEHFRRIEYANKKFGRGAPTKGWRTDRGRIYIILGKPMRIEKFQRMQTHPIEIWYYQGNPKFGQAPIFRLLFFQREGVGSFELYNPIADGPKVLVPQSSMRVPSGGLRRNRRIYETVKDDRDIVAYEILKMEVSPELAEAAWSSFPGRDGPEFSLPSVILIDDVQNYPQKKVKDDYAYEYLEHKAVVEVDYSMNHINNLSRIQILEDKKGLFFVNYSMEPETLSVDFYDDKYFTNIKISIRVTDFRGKTIIQHTRNFPIEMKKEQLNKVLQRPFHLYDSFPLIPGNYKLDILFENTVTKEFTSVGMDIYVPEPGALQMGALILAERVDKNSPHAQVNKAFQIGSLQIYPSLKNYFHKESNLFLFLQIYGLSQELEEQGSLEFSFSREGKEFQTLTRKIKEYNNKRDFLQEFSLKKFPPGNYIVKVSFLDGEGREIFSERSKFSVVAKPLPESWIVSRSNPQINDPVYSFLIGTQFMNKGEIKKARNELEKAFMSDPGLLDYALNYARTLLILKEFSRAREILLPFLETKKVNFTLYYYLGRSSQESGELKEAISYYQKALSHKGNVIEILNSIGECYLKLGEREQALRVLKKSLEIKPSQGKISKIVKSLEK